MSRRIDCDSSEEDSITANRRYAIPSGVCDKRSFSSRYDSTMSDFGVSANAFRAIARCFSSTIVRS